MTVTFADAPELGLFCGECRGTGRFHNRNARPTRLPCFKCNGKGHQSSVDVQRNQAYARRVALRLRVEHAAIYDAGVLLGRLA